MELRSNEPGGPIETSWERHRFEMKLVNPANKRKHTVLVVGTGLAGASASATLAELGYSVKAFCFKTPRDGLTALRPRVASTRQRITRAMATVFIACFTTP